MHSFGTLRPSAAATRRFPQPNPPLARNTAIRDGKTLCDGIRHSAQQEADLLFARRGLSLRFWFHPCAGKMAGQKTGPADVSAAIHGIDLSDIVFRKDGQYPSRVNHPAHHAVLPAQPAGRHPPYTSPCLPQKLQPHPTARGAGCCLCKLLPGHLCGYQVTDPLRGILGNGGALALQHPLAV